MLAALLASVSSGIFAAHVRDAFRTGQHPAVTFGLGPSCAEIQTITTDAIANAGTLQSPSDSNSGSRLLHVNGRFAPKAARQHQSQTSESPFAAYLN